ncbi:hypothetical protein [Halorubrum sp. 2020YC2]|nr:hypothetical protein [Halorubrum sp. 2020YC2]
MKTDLWTTAGGARVERAPVPAEREAVPATDATDAAAGVVA